MNEVHMIQPYKRKYVVILYWNSSGRLLQGYCTVGFECCEVRTISINQFAMILRSWLGIGFAFWKAE